jgi:VanZ family protein
MQSSTTQTAVALGLSRRGCQAGNRGLPPTYSRKRLSRYGPLLLWATLIFIGSTSVLSASNTSVILRVIVWLFPQTSPATLGTIHFLIRKTGHLAEYAILALLTARAITTSSYKLLRTQWFWISLSIVIVYALGDEFHQSFVPSRTASIYDSLIDSFGGLTALTLLAFVRSIIRPVCD